MLGKSFLFLTAVIIAVCCAGRIPSSNLRKNGRKQAIPLEKIDPKTARVLLSNDFESGSSDPWYDSSPSVVHWVVEDIGSPSEVDNPPPELPAGTSKYLRATRNDQLSSGLLILRTVTFTAIPGDQISFNFWIRSKYTGGNTLELILANGTVESTLVTLSGYSTSVNNEWRPSSVLIPVEEPTDVTLIFYGYCGSNSVDAIAIDDIVVESTISTTVQETETGIPTTITPTTTTSTTTTSTTTTPTTTTPTTTTSTTTTPTTTTPTTTPTTTVCGGTYGGDTGSISSPNYPNPYGFNEDCRYLIRPISGRPITLTFVDFNTEGGFDFVTVYDGPTTDATVLLRVSGYTADNVETTGPECLVIHTSDSKNSMTGWRAQYTA